MFESSGGIVAMRSLARLCVLLLAIGLCAGAKATRETRHVLGVSSDPLQEVLCEDVVQIEAYEDACAFVKEHCTSESIIPYVRVYYCNIAQRSTAARVGWHILLFMLLLLLFRVLATTADDFFSPALMQLSQDLGLPPRFAGVTFLALGNGAPDVGASIVAVQKGRYSMAMGALIGSGMFVGCVVGGSVILAGEGIKAKGAFIRDVCAYIITVICVVLMFVLGKVAVWGVIALLGLYCTYVFTVLAADLWHMVKKRRKERGALGESLLPQPPPLVELPSELTSEEQMEQDIWEADELFHPNREELLALTTRQYSLRALAAVSNSTSYAGMQHDVPSLFSAPSFASVDGQSTPFLIAPSWPSFTATRGQQQAPANIGQNTARSAPCVEPSLPKQCLSISVSTESLPSPFFNDGLTPNKSEETDMEPPSCWRTSIDYGQACLSTAELPLTYIRRATIPLIEAESYNRAWFIISCALGPLFVALYLQQCNAVSWVVAATLGLLCCAAGALATRGSSSAPQWSCGTSIPIGAAGVALVGFVIAAMWIDTLANELVGLLEFVGILSGLDHSILGLTVLAWGNSIGDLSTNVTMARRGLSNMAITACFAGPVFNTLVGLGCGFLALLKGMDKSSVAVQFPLGILPGAVLVLVNGAFLIVSGWLNGGRIPPRYGWVSFGLYGTYLLLTILMTWVL